MENLNDLDNFERWQKTFRTVTRGLYFAIMFLEIAIYFVLRSQNMIYESTKEYMLTYMFRPIFINTAIVVLGLHVIRRSRSSTVKKYAHLFMLTLMFGNAANVHNVFLVALVSFCIPIFLAVIFKDIKLLNVITIVSEAMVLLIAGSDYVFERSVSKMDYFIPSVIIVMILLVSCRGIAAIAIGILKEQNEALLQAMKEAREAQRVADASNQSKTVFLSSMSHEIEHQSMRF